MDATPPPRREPLDLNSAVRNAVSASFGDVVVGLSLVLLFSFSFVGAWFQTELFCPEPVYGPGTIFGGGGAGTCADWVAGGTLWSGFGLLPALLLVAALLFFLVRRLSRVRLTLPVPEGVVWIVFAAVETGLLFLYWVIPSPAGLSPYPSSAMATPGWVFWVAVGLGGLLFAGGLLKLLQGEGGEPAAPAEHLGSGVAPRPVPPRPRLGEVAVGVALVALFAFSFAGAWFQAAAGCIGIAVPGSSAGVPGIPYMPSCVSQTYFFGSLWSGLGLLPALLLVAALLFFVIRRLPQVRLRLPVPEALIWVVFAVVEIGLFILNWVTSNGGVLSTGPGWAFWVGVGLAGLLGVGGCTMFFQAEGSGLPGPAPGLPALNLPIGTLSPDGTRWFDGAGWRDVVEAVPPGAPRSEDGGHWWDGQGWRPVPASPVPGPARAKGRRAGPGPGFPAA